MKSSKSSASMLTPSPQMKPSTSLDSARLTKSEIDSLRQKKKLISDYVQKELEGSLGLKIAELKKAAYRVPNSAILTFPLKCQAALQDTIHWQRLSWPVLLTAQWLYRKMGEGGPSTKPIEFQLNSEVLGRLFLGGFPTLRRTLF